MNDDRSIPEAVASERAVIGTILVAPGSLDRLDGFDPADMLDPFARDAVTVALDIGEPFDVVLVAQHLAKLGHRDALRRLHEIVCDDAWSPGVLARHVAAIRDTARRRRVIELACAVQDAAHDGADVSGPLARLTEVNR